MHMPHRKPATVIALVALLLALTQVVTLAQPADPTPSADAEEREPDPSGLRRGVVFASDAAFPGYTLFTPLTSRYTMLIDHGGSVVHQWESESYPGMSVYLLENGDLLRSGQVSGTQFSRRGGHGGVIERQTWDGEPVWSFTYSSETGQQHHDIEIMPNGNVLFIAWEYHPTEEAIAAGLDPGFLTDEGDREAGIWSDSIYEYDPVADEIVWEWHSWDHLVQDFDESLPNYGVVAESPGRLNLNYFQASYNKDLFHMNAVVYNPELDQIMLSARNFSEVWMIDHSITSEEAAGAAGDLLYRFGNPAAYDRGDRRDFLFLRQHDPTWIPDGYPGAGNIILYDNGWLPIRRHSRIAEFTLPLLPDGSYAMTDGAFATPTLAWEYIADPPETFFSAFASGVQRLPNGNTLICDCFRIGRVFEITPDGTAAWVFANQSVAAGYSENGRLFRADRYPLDYPAFAGRDLSPLGGESDAEDEVTEE